VKTVIHFHTKGRHLAVAVSLVPLGAGDFRGHDVGVSVGVWGEARDCGCPHACGDEGLDGDHVLRGVLDASQSPIQVASRSARMLSPPSRVSR
jgi:hypothetical protein